MAFRDRLTRAAGLIAGFVNLWASLLALGLVPTIATVLAVLVGFVTGAYQQALVVALLVALIVDLVLLVVAIRAKAYAKALEGDMELIGNMMRERREPAPPWLPDKEGRLPVSNADFERMFDDAMTHAQTVGADAQLGVAWIELARPLLAFNGFTQTGRKRFRVWCDPKNGCQIVHVERSDTARYPIDEPQWRQDSTWTELVRQATAVEEPFDGMVTMWPRRSSTPVGAGLWRIEFRRDEAGMIDMPRPYVLVDGVLTKGT